jgi:hypothetical protein
VLLQGFFFASAALPAFPSPLDGDTEVPFHGEIVMIIFLPFLLSLDSLFASFALCASRVERSRQMKLAVTFGICDGVASLIRGTFDLSTGSVSWVTSHQFHVAVGTYLIAVFLVWLFEAAKPFGSPLLWTVPVVLSIDNLVGPSVEPISLGSVTLVVVASASMSFVGFRLGTFLAGITHNAASQPAFLRRLMP